MSNTGYKKYISVLVIVMLLLLLQSITVPAITIAEESSNALEEYRQLYEATDVLDDLEGVDLSGYEDMETISVISFNAFAFLEMLSFVGSKAKLIRLSRYVWVIILFPTKRSLGIIWSTSKDTFT